MVDPVTYILFLEERTISRHKDGGKKIIKNRKRTRFRSLLSIMKIYDFYGNLSKYRQ